MIDDNNSHIALYPYIRAHALDIIIGAEQIQRNNLYKSTEKQSL